MGAQLMQLKCLGLNRWLIYVTRGEPTHVKRVSSCLKIGFIIDEIVHKVLTGTKVWFRKVIGLHQHLTSYESRRGHSWGHQLRLRL